MKKVPIQRAFAVLLAMAMLVTSLYIPDRAAYAAAKSVKSIKLKIGTKNVTKKTYKMTKGKTKKLKVTVKPASSKKRVTYRSKNSKIVSVSKKGLLTAKKAGTAKIIVKAAGKKGAVKKTWVKIKVLKKKTGKDPKDETDPGNTNDRPSTPSVPSTPSTPSVPSTPSMPSTPSAPSTPSVPVTPGYSGGGSSGYWPANPSGSSNGQESDTVVSTRQQLLAALEKHPSEVTFKTERETKVEIPKGTYQETTLIVDAPNATIENAAVYKEIRIIAIAEHTWIEKAIGNLINVVAKATARIQAAAGAEADIQINEGAGNVEIEVAAEAKADIEVKGAAKEVKVTNEGMIGSFSLSAETTLLIRGNNQKRIPLTVDENGKNATVNTSVPLDVIAEAAIVLQLHGEAKKESDIKVSNTGAMPTIVAAVKGYLQVTNLATGRADDVLVTMPSPGDPGFETEPLPEGTGSIIGTIKSITAEGEEAKETPVKGAAVHVIPYERGILESDLEMAIRAAENREKCYTENTNEDGKYTVENIPYGNYVIVVKAAGFQTYLYTIVFDEESKQMDTITMIPSSASGTGSIKGSIKDAFTGELITDTVKLYLRKGAGTVAGEAEQVTETTNGEYSFENLPIGVYTIRVVDERPTVEEGNYINVAFNVVVLDNMTIGQNMTITKAIEGSQIRFVLRWGAQSNEVASDLDSHLVGPKASENGLFHTYYTNKYYPANPTEESMEAGLDVDHTCWEGPETTTIYQKTDGVYHFYVYDYSERWVVNNKKLAASKAKVDIYLGGRLLTSYNVPDGEGTLWDVCTYDTETGEFTPVNKIYDYPAEAGSGGIGLVNEIKRSLDGLIERYSGHEADYFGSTVAAEVSARLQKARENKETLQEFDKVLQCFVELNRYLKELLDSTEITKKDVTFEGMRKCYIERRIRNGYSVINLSGDGEGFPTGLKFQTASGIVVSKPENVSGMEGFEKKVVVTNNTTKAEETYYIHYEKYEVNLDVYGITAAGNKNLRWETIRNVTVADKTVDVLAVTGSALQLVKSGPAITFTFGSSYDGITIDQNYETLEGQGEYVGKLTVEPETGDGKVYYVTYGSLLEPDDVKDGDNEINSWYVEHKGINGNINCIHIYGAESKLTTGPALVFNGSSDTEISSTYEPMEDKDYAGKFTVTYKAGPEVSKEYFVKYTQGTPEIELIYVWDEKNTLSLPKEDGKYRDGNKIYAIEGSADELRDSASFCFNVSVTKVKMTSAESADEPWNYKLELTCDSGVEIIYIKYTKKQ